MFEVCEKRNTFSTNSTTWSPVLFFFPLSSWLKIKFDKLLISFCFCFWSVNVFLLKQWQKMNSALLKNWLIFQTADQFHSCTNQTGSPITFELLYLHIPIDLFSWRLSCRSVVLSSTWSRVSWIMRLTNEAAAILCIKHFNYITMREYTIPSSVC